MKYITQMCIVGFILMLIIIGINIGLWKYTQYQEQNDIDKCRADFKGGFQTEKERNQIEDKCLQSICQDFGLKKSDVQTWAKATIYCEGNKGGIIAVRMPSYSNDKECDHYFRTRWWQAMCLQDVGHIDETTI